MAPTASRGSPGQSEQFRDQSADEQGDRHLEDARPQSPASERPQLASGDLEADREQKQGNTDFGDVLDVLGFAVDPAEDPGAHEHARHHAADDAAGSKTLEEHADHGSRGQQQYDVTQDVPGFHRSVSSRSRLRVPHLVQFAK